MRKLLASNANLLFWVYYGNHAFEPLVNSIDVAGRINVLHFPLKFGKLSIKPQNPKPIETVESKPVKKYNFVEVRKKYPNAYKKWSSEQDEMLKEYFKKGLSVSEMANKLQRKSGAIRSRIRKLGLR